MSPQEDKTLSGYSNDGFEGVTADSNGKRVDQSVKNMSQDAVCVRNAYKSYGKSNPVLKNLNMSVKRGTIYSLLGSSGCGKTTLLSAIVGIKSLDSGQIRVFGKVPGQSESGIPGKLVGHMPQEYALYPDFSIQESLNYFGKIYGLSTQKMEERSTFLIKFLQLPDPDRRIGNLSGGQKRRVSLAVSLIHEPRLLILDEPTVGVDHLLRENIWSLLKELVSSGKTTVVITTHYIEESRGSDVIGFMRNGRILAEDSPQTLLERYDTTHLEEVVLNLSKMDEDQQQQLSEVEVVQVPNGSANRSIAFNSNKTSSLSDVTSSPNKPSVNRMQTFDVIPLAKEEPIEPTPRFAFHRFSSLVKKDLVLLFRNYIFLLFTIITPALQVIVSCLSIGNDPRHLSFGVVNRENPYGCMDHSPNISNITGLDYNIGDCSAPANWSCLFLEKLERNEAVDLIYFTDELEAREKVKKMELWGYVTFQQNFSQHLFDRRLEGLHPTEESIAGSTIGFHMDFSGETVASLLQKIIFKTFTDFSKDVVVMEGCGGVSESAELPIKFEEPVFGTQETNYREYLAPSLLMSILFFLPLTASGISYIADRKGGTLDRSLVAGVSSFEIMAANCCSQVLVLTVQASLSLLIMTNAFHIRVVGNYGEALLLAVLIGISGMSMGFLVSSIVTEEIQAVIIAIATFFPNFALAGIVWPVQGMPLALQYLGYFLPCTLASEAMRSIVTRGLSFAHSNVWPGFATTLGWIAIYWGLTLMFHKFSSSRR